MIFTAASARRRKSIADATDLAAIGEGLGTGAIAWMVLMWLVLFFLGGALAAALSDRPGRAAGMLHGVVVWSVAVAVSLVLGAMTLNALWNAAASVTSGAAQAVQGVGSAVVQGGQAAVSATQTATSALEGTPLYTNLQAELKREAARILAAGQANGAADVSTQEISQAAEQIDAEALRQAASALVQGDRTGAAEALANATGLSVSEVQSVVAGIAENVSESTPVQQAEQWLDQELRELASTVSEAAGPQVQAAELREAVGQLDANTLQQVAMALISGNTQQAKDVLAVNTTLTTEEIDAVVDGVSSELSAEVNELQQQFDAAVETVSNYAQGVLWLEFAATALGLLLAAVGGAFGARRAERALETRVAE